MGASKVHSSGIASAALLLMDAMNQERIKSKQDMYADGWITAKDYANQSGVATNTAKRLLDSFVGIEKKRAKDCKSVVTMYRIKKGKTK